MRILIVDDEILSCNRCERILMELNYSDITKVTSGEEAIQISKNKPFDIVFCDIQMQGINGIETANILTLQKPSICIVFMTAFSLYALDSYKVHAIDFLLKPISEENVVIALEKAFSYRINMLGNNDEKIIIRDDNRLTFVKLEDIYIVNAHLKEIIIQTKDKEYCVNRTFSEFTKILNQNLYLKVHRSTIINADKINSLRIIEQGKYEISFIDIPHKVYTSRSGAKLIREIYNI